MRLWCADIYDHSTLTRKILMTKEDFYALHID